LDFFAIFTVFLDAGFYVYSFLTKRDNRIKACLSEIAYRHKHIHIKIMADYQFMAVLQALRAKKG
jgi:hypothetical protein